MTPTPNTPSAEALADLEKLNDLCWGSFKDNSEEIWKAAMTFCREHGETIRTSLTAPIEKIDEAIAWKYELATMKDDNGDYTGWSQCLTGYKPNVPEGSMRNLTPLYAQGRTQAVPDYSALLNAYSLLKHAAQHQVAVPWGLIMPQLEQHSRSLSAAPPVTGGAWLPIESAEEKDKHEILALIQGCDTGRIRRVVLEFDEFQDDWLFNGAEISNAWDIIGYQPLPAPPSSAEKEGV